jgi:uncharacterized membrane protein YedE/YeeE
VNLLSEPWPWYVAGPLMGLMVPLLLWMGNRLFGLSSTLMHVCAATTAGDCEFLNYDWKTDGAWNLVFVLGVLLGGVLCGTVLADPETFVIAASTQADLEALGFSNFDTIAPPEIFTWSALATVPGFIVLVVGGFLVGFGARYASGCTSGHAIFGLSNLQLPSLVAVLGFFAGGMFSTHVLLPVLFG